MLAFHTDQDTLNRRLEVQVGQSQAVIAMLLLLLLYVLVTIVVVIIIIIIIIITIVIMALNDIRGNQGVEIQISFNSPSKSGTVIPTLYLLAHVAFEVNNNNNKLSKSRFFFSKLCF